MEIAFYLNFFLTDTILKKNKETNINVLKIEKIPKTETKPKVNSLISMYQVHVISANKQSPFLSK